MSTFVLVHGAWHGGTAWRLVENLLRAAGHEVVARDLPGCGANAPHPGSYEKQDWSEFERELSPVATIDLEDWTAAVDSWVKEASTAAGSPVIVVAHSLGGLPMTGAADRAPNDVKHLVYLTAHCVVERPNVLAYFHLPENNDGLTGSVRVGNSQAIGAIRINPRSQDPKYRALLRECLYGDVPAPIADRLLAALSTDMPVRVLRDDARATLDGWGRIPRTYIRCTQDRTLPPALQDLMIAEADAATPDNIFTVKTIDSSHSPYASKPGDVADILLALAS